MSRDVLFVVLLAVFHVGHTQRDGSTRLVDGVDDSQGRVEVYANHQWGTVCDDFWPSYSSTNPLVVCRKLGFTDLASSAYRCCAGFGQGSSLPILLDNVKCTGEEDHLVDCPHNGVGVTDCSHFEDVGVTCFCSANPECAKPAENCPYFRTEFVTVPHRRCPICRCASCPSQPKCPTNCKSGQTMYYDGEVCRRCKCKPQELPDVIEEENDISLGMLLSAVIIMLVVPTIALIIVCVVKKKQEKKAAAKAKAAKEKAKAMAMERELQNDCWFEDQTPVMF